MELCWYHLILPNHSFSLTKEIVYRVQLKGNKYVLGEFLEFKGKQEDVEALRHIRRSKVGRIIIQKTSMFGLGNLLGINHDFTFQLY